MDFDNGKVYGDTSITDGLVILDLTPVTSHFDPLQFFYHSMQATIDIWALQKVRDQKKGKFKEKTSLFHNVSGNAL